MRIERVKLSVKDSKKILKLFPRWMAAKITFYPDENMRLIVEFKDN